MKKIISLFLSLILTFSMTLGVFVPGVASATPGSEPVDKTLIKEKIVEYDTTNRIVSYYHKSRGQDYLASKSDGETAETRHYNMYFRRYVFNCVVKSDGYEMQTMRNEAGDQYISYYLNANSAGVTDSTMNGGIYTFSGKFRCDKSKGDGSGLIDFSTCEISAGGNEFTGMSAYLEAGVWYKYKFIVDDSGSSPVVTVAFYNVDITDSFGNPTEVYIESAGISGETCTIRTDMDISDYSASFNSSLPYISYKHMKYEKEFPNDTVQQATILSVDSDGGGVAPNQNQLTFRLDNAISGLTKDHIMMEIDGLPSSKVTASEIVALSDGGKTVTVEFPGEGFTSWTNYNLYIDPVVYDGYVKRTGGSKVTQNELKLTFPVKAEGLSMREKTPPAQDGSNITFTMEYVDTDSVAKPITLLLSVFGSDGKMTDFTSVTPPMLSTNNTTIDVSASAAFTSGSSAKLFAIDGWSGKTPYFNRDWEVNVAPSSLSAYSSAEPMSFGAFNYTDKKISVRVNTNTGAEKKGVLYIYDSRYALSDGASPEYVDFLTTAYDGTFEIEIPFKTDVNSASYDTTTYNVEFYYPGGSVSDTFTCYDKDDRQTQKETAIFNQAKAAATVGVLKQVIEGLNINEVKVNDNFAIFDVKADLSVFESLKNKDNVYSLMFSSVSSLANYQALVDLFEAKAKVQYNNENVVITEPSSDNSSYGGFGGGMKDTSPVIPAQPGNTGVSGTSGFSDMTGHWASEFASELSKRGIMNGYPNGSFNGEGLITRAELAKTLVEAVDIALGTNSSYYDVDANAWHSPYIAGAANAGIITGFENGSFGPELNVTRQDAALMIYRALGTKMTLPVGYTFFTDDFDISDYASDAIRCLGELKIINGTPDGRFNPLAPITRAEIAALICRSLDYIESH